MQTFLPYASFRDSARCLDYRRLGKQRVECKQLLLALGIPVGDHIPGRSPWGKHPAAKMWWRYELALCEYAREVCCEWRERGYRDTLLMQFVYAEEYLLDHQSQQCFYPPGNPHWLGRDEIHASHRSNLLRKDREWYSRFGWSEPDDLPYVWPVSKEVAA